MHSILCDDSDRPQTRVDSLLKQNPEPIRASELVICDDPLPGTQCERCGSCNLIEAQAKPPHFLELVCGDCGRHLRFLSAPPEVRQAGRHVLTFGKFKGMKLRDLARTARGRRYLVWIGANAYDDDAAAAARTILGVAT